MPDMPGVRELIFMRQLYGRELTLSGCILYIISSNLSFGGVHDTASVTAVRVGESVSGRNTKSRQMGFSFP